MALIYFHNVRDSFHVASRILTGTGDLNINVFAQSATRLRSPKANSEQASCFSPEA